MADTDGVHGMGRLKRIELENFKSYAGSQTIGPFQDFTAVIGPNGAGKSNLMDAISFVLGVQSRHLRSQKLDDLVFRADGETKASGRASVKIVYEVGTDEIEGMEAGEEAQFSRVIQSGASKYKFNDKEVSWQVYEQRLEDIGVLVKARNFLVFQGDVEGIAQRTPKQLTELFEQISGSDSQQKEYELRRRAMEAAEADALFSAQQRKACQAERKIVKEQKEEAERFEAKQAELQALRREYFLVQLFHLDKDKKECEQNLSLMKEELDEFSEQEKEAEAELKARKKEYASLSRKLATAEAAAENARGQLADLGPSDIKLREQLRALERQVEDLKKAAADLESDRDKQQETIENLEADISEATAEEEVLTNRIDAEGQHEQLGAGRAAEYEALKAEARRATQAKRDELEAARRALAAGKVKLEAAIAEEATIKLRLTAAEESIQQYTQRRASMAAAAEATQAEIVALEAELALVSETERRDEASRQRIEHELGELDEKLRDARAGRQETNQEAKLAESLAALKRLYPQVLGRLTDLCKPSQKKFNVAVATAAGRHMDAIVVDTYKCACDCVTYIRNQRTGVAAFIPLDKIRPKPINERLRTLGPRYRLCADIVQCDEKIRPAVAFAVGNAVVADTLEDARELCFKRNERVKCVTLQGALIAKGGNMTGGTTAREGNAAARWDEQEVQELKQERDELRVQLAALGRSHRQESHRAELKTKIKGLTSKANHALADSQLCDEKLKGLQQQKKLAETQAATASRAREKAERAVQGLEATASELNDQLEAAEDEVFADFVKSVGVRSVRDFEEGPMKAVQSLMKKRLKHRERRAQLEAQLGYEKSRNFVEPLAKVQKKLTERAKDMADVVKKQARLKQREQALMEDGDVLDAEVARQKQAASAKDKEVRAAQSERAKRSKEKGSVSKRMVAEETVLERLRAQLHEVLQRSQVEEVDLPMREGHTSDDEMDEDDRPTPTSTSTSQSQGESGPHFSQPDSKAVRADTALIDKVDLSQLKKHKRLATKHELDEILDKYVSQMAGLRAEVERMTPNLKSVEQFATAQEKARDSATSFDAAKQKSKAAHQAFEKARDTRREQFEEAFQHVSTELETIYKELTRSSKHPLGGQAHLSVDDQEEPYNGGIKFSAMPPGKRLRDMDQLSGGERTVAALALLFAIHSYRPAPFFVMDEIDAALDNINVKKVCHFIENRAANGIFQSIVISLKDMFYEKADALVGICRDASTNSSRTLTLDLTQFDDNIEEVQQ